MGEPCSPKWVVSIKNNNQSHGNFMESKLRLGLSQCIEFKEFALLTMLYGLIAKGNCYGVALILIS
jgi:hypothetical protein